MNVKGLVDGYYKWLSDRTTFSEDNESGWITINTPFVGIYNDYIQIFAKHNADNTIVLSDDGETLRNLELVGVTIDKRSTKRYEWMNYILLNYGVSNNNGELEVTTSMDNFNQSKYNLISCILSLSEMEVLTPNSVSSMYKEDVWNFLKERNVPYVPDLIIKGSLNIGYTFDFLIPRGDSELVIKPFQRIDKSNLSNFLFYYDDVKELRQTTAKKKFDALAVVKYESNPKPEFLHALSAKNVGYVLWDRGYNDSELLNAIGYS